MSSQQLLREGPTSNDIDLLAPELSKELSHWEHLVFSFDMDNEKNDPNRNPPPQSADEIQTAALLAQLAASTGTIFPSSQGGPYSSPFQGHPSASGYNSGPRSFVSPANLSLPYGLQPYPFNSGVPLPSQIPASLPDTTRTRARSQSQAGPSTSNAAADDDDDYEDKRRRNTAASARFRIKKKQKTLGLERTVSDLTGRAEELEREAADLRRENGWLKEIVMLKGGRLAGIDLSRTDTRGSGSGQRDQRRGSSERDGSDSESGEDRGQGSGKSKGKGKGKQK
ncbi:Cytochrome C oxidase assembly protein COX19 [Mycena sanguinolenta]|uniref:Cytochrome C oxidase assembly protein COX19 n=1 Tax=Mycena sanguinolenta TaxID=230812 RepID=A0A8H6YU67_9AGAR|nr:Cytochrome C oxidase assembly protein COX19 [Mycena sanguinolenta]